MTEPEIQAFLTQFRVDFVARARPLHEALNEVGAGLSTSDEAILEEVAPILAAIEKTLREQEAAPVRERAVLSASETSPLTAADVEALEQESVLIIRTLSGVVESTYPLDVHRTRLALIAYAHEAAKEARRAAFEEAAQLVVGEVIRIELIEEFMPPPTKGDVSLWQKHVLGQVASHIRALAERSDGGQVG